MTTQMFTKSPGPPAMQNNNKALIIQHHILRWISGAFPSMQIPCFAKHASGVYDKVSLASFVQ